MTLASKIFDSRLRRLEEVQESFEQAKPLLITVMDVEKHYGDFAVECGHVEMVLNRGKGESWEMFEKRLIHLALELRGPLRLLTFFPITEAQ